MAGKRRLNLPSELLPEQPPEPQVPDQPAATTPPAASFPPPAPHESLNDFMRRMEEISQEQLSQKWRGLANGVDNGTISRQTALEQMGLTSAIREAAKPGNSDGPLPGNLIRRPDPIREAERLVHLSQEERNTHLQRLEQEDPVYMRQVRDHVAALLVSQARAHEIARRAEEIGRRMQARERAPVIRTYADLTRSLNDKMERVKANAAKGSPEQQSVLIFSHGRIFSENNRKPYVGDYVMTETGMEVGVVTQVRAVMNGPWLVDIRAPDGYHLGSIPVG